MAKVVSIANFKGGVGKTTSTVNIGAALAQRGKRVLLVDMDPQFNLTSSLGVREPAYTVYGVLRGEHGPAPIQVYEGLDLLASSLVLIKAEVELSTKFRREDILNQALETVKGQYDFILIDCPPSLGLLTINAFVASDLILVPVEAEYLALTGYAILNEAISEVGLEIDGVFITKYDNRKILNRNVVETINSSLGARAFDTLIRENVALAEAPARGLDIFRYSPKSQGAEDYQALVEELLTRF